MIIFFLTPLTIETEAQHRKNFREGDYLHFSSTGIYIVWNSFLTPLIIKQKKEDIEKNFEKAIKAVGIFDAIFIL